MSITMPLSFPTEKHPADQFVQRSAGNRVLQLPVRSGVGANDAQRQNSTNVVRSGRPGQLAVLTFACGLERLFAVAVSCPARGDYRASSANTVCERGDSPQAPPTPPS